MDIIDLPSTAGFAVDYSGLATCGYCAQTFSWPGVIGAAMAVGYLTLTGWVGLVRGEADSVVVAFEVTAGGRESWLPHTCESIPADVLAEAVTA